MSIDSLPSNDNKDLFKHIACFFVGIDRDVTLTILNACNINTKLGITNLIDRCLLSIRWDNVLMMHQLVQETGRDLVRQESPYKPWERTRLWCHEESLEVLKRKKGTDNVLGLALDMRMLDTKKLRGPFELNTKSLSKMDRLMLLQLNYVHFNGCFDKFPEDLRWLCMHGFPLKSIPLDLPMENLAALDMSYSNIESFDMSKDKQLLESLKILDLSFCERLISVGGFIELPTLERLMVRNCISLIEVCESIQQCVELVHIDLSYCRKLKKLPMSLGKLKKVKTLLLDGCASRESAIIRCEMNSSAITEAIPSDLKFFTISLPSSLTRLSLANNNLCNESFPMDLSCLAMLEELCLDKNPIVSMPNWVRTLPRLKVLLMNYCSKVTSIENPPRTLIELSICVDHDKNLLRKIKLDPEMSSLRLFGYFRNFSITPLEIDGVVKNQGVAGVEDKVLHSLGWINLDFIKERRFEVYEFLGPSFECQTQLCYEFGIFSTFYLSEEMPDWIEFRSNGSSISFTVPSSPKKLRGLNFCFMEMSAYWEHERTELPMIKVSNITKNHTWIYKHFIHYVKSGGECITFLSHWMFGPNEMKDGDHITISVERYNKVQHTRECGYGLLYGEEGNNEEEEDVLGYYKSWNHIIGGDLSHFQITTGEYILDNNQFIRHSKESLGDFHPFIDYKAVCKEEEMIFKAFSQNKSEIDGQVHFNTGTLLSSHSS